MKKRVFLKIIVALALLASILLSSLLGVSKAEYFKKMSKKLDFEARPDLALEYILYDADDGNSATDGKTDRASTTYHKKQSVYKNSESFVQKIVVGKKNPDTTTFKDADTYTGAGVGYKIKIPVDETGYYTLNFSTYMLAGESGNEALQFYTLSYVFCVGCEVLNARDGIAFNETPFAMPQRVFKGNEHRATYSAEPLLYSDSAVLGDADTTNDSVYQWKTLCPSRSENVRLTFKVEDQDVQNGYVIWAWDFTGLQGEHTYRLFVDSLSVEKTMELNGTTKYRTADDPYFMFPQTAYINNIMNTSNTPASGSGGRTGKSRTSNGRGTFVTEATDNSLGMRAEMLYSDTGSSVDNPLGIYVPLKNVQKNATYKVTFDFSIARQGSDGANPDVFNGYSGTLDWHSYDGDFEKIFLNVGSEKMFQSYLVSGLTTNKARTTEEHKTKQSLITYADKQYQGQGVPLVKYDEVTKFNGDYADVFGGTEVFPDYSTSDSVNDTYSIRHYNGQSSNITFKSTQMRNFFNAVQHEEYNGQNKINWITFYNTTFTFNISNGADVNDLYWVWAIDSLRYTAYYNLRIDNVRIQRVVEYASELNDDAGEGLKIAGTPIGTDHMCHYGKNTSAGMDESVFRNYRGWNSTGQNYQARGYDTNRYMIKGNIYAPIVDASGFTVATEDDNAYLIELDGRAIVDGGVDKYVFSIDGGRTWQNMTFSGRDATAAELVNAEAGIDMRVQGQSFEDNFNAGLGYERIKFDTADAKNGSFDGWKLAVNLSDYKTDANLDIIIAAVPHVNSNFRCEILRIINFNQMKNYRTYCNEFTSDICVNTAGNNLVAYSTAGGAGGSENTVKFSEMRGWLITNPWGGANGPNRAGSGYSRIASYSYDYDDIRVLFSDFPVYTDLSIGGWAIVEGGIDNYYWSVDEGKTWNLCAGEPQEGGVNSDQRACWYDGSTATDDATALAMKSKLTFETNKLTAELDDYVGQCVDVIFCVKPNDSDVLCPVARINNVAVYGENGTFYTRLHRVILDQSIKEGDKSPVYVPVTAAGADGAYFNGTDKWSMGFNAYAYTIFEPQNVDVTNTRFYNNQVNEMQSGGVVTIDGFVVCKGGVSRYKFSLDGGETWTVINDAGANISDSTTFGTGSNDKMITEAKKSDATFASAKDGVKGDYCCYYNYYNDKDKLDPDDADERTKYYNHALEFNLPALPAGSQRNLLVVAESTNGKLFPVLHIKLQFKYKDGQSSQYGYYRDKNLSSGSNIEKAGWVSLNQSWEYPLIGSATNSKNNNSFNRMTIPVTEAGNFNLNLTHQIQEGVSITNNGLYLHSRKDVTSNGITVPKATKIQNTFDGVKHYSRARATMSLEKTHFMQGEPIEVSYSFRSGQYYKKGDLSDVVVCIVSAEWKNIYGNRFTVCGYTIPDSHLPQTLDVATSTHKVDLKAIAEANKGNYPITRQQHLKDLPAGKYSIFLVNHAVPLKYADVDSNDCTNADEWLLARIDDIYIHSQDEVVDYTVLHDSGDETCFSDVNQFFDNSSTDSRIAGRYRVENPFTTQNISIPVTVTPEDVKRGYIVLDMKFSKFLYQSITVPEEVREKIKVDDKEIMATVIHAADQIHVKYPFTATVNGNFVVTLGTTPLVKRTS